jgi:hypothetical protein
MGRVASSVDNTMIESFWSTMQREPLDRQQWTTRHQLATRDLRVDRGVLQPRPPTLRARLPQPRRLRCPSHRHNHQGMITTHDVSEEPGQACRGTGGR